VSNPFEAPATGDRATKRSIGVGACLATTASRDSRRACRGASMILRLLCAVFLSFVAADRAFADDAVDVAASLIGRPYACGAEGPRAFDCSGLTHYVYQRFGVELPRRAVTQSTAGKAAGRRLQRGDLIFFASDRKRSLVTHVGIYEGGGMMINASQRHGRVRRDDLDEPFWAERYMFARRVSEEGPSDDDRPKGAREDAGRGPDPPSNRRKETLRILGRVADVLLRRPE
jgi:NlpC/P60 family